MYESIESCNINSNTRIQILYAVIALMALYIIMSLCSSYSKKSAKALPSRGGSGRGGSGGSGKPSFYFSPSCPHCVKQKDIITESGLSDKFKAVNCQETPDQCKGVSGVPMFAKGDKKLVGTQSVDKLKDFLSS